VKTAFGRGADGGGNGRRGIHGYGGDGFSGISCVVVVGGINVGAIAFENLFVITYKTQRL